MCGRKMEKDCGWGKEQDNKMKTISDFWREKKIGFNRPILGQPKLSTGTIAEGLGSRALFSLAINSITFLTHKNKSGEFKTMS